MSKKDQFDIEEDISDLMYDNHGELCAKLLRNSLLDDYSTDMLPYSTLMNTYIDPETGLPIKED